MDNDKVTGLISLDFKKTFDVVNYNILPQKLQIYGVSDAAFQWFRSYLSDRWQCVRVNGCTSSLLPINQGIPQGTIIGPMLFLLFINDIPLHIQNSNIDIYADDVTLTSCSKWNNISSVNNNIRGDLENIQHWANINKMVINEKKTKSMLVIGKRLRKRLNQDQHQDSDLSIALNE